MPPDNIRVKYRHDVVFSCLFCYVMLIVGSNSSSLCQECLGSADPTCCLESCWVFFFSSGGTHKQSRSEPQPGEMQISLCVSSDTILCLSSLCIRAWVSKPGDQAALDTFYLCRFCFFNQTAEWQEVMNWLWDSLLSLLLQSACVCFPSDWVHWYFHLLCKTPVASMVKD